MRDKIFQTIKRTTIKNLHELAGGVKNLQYKDSKCFPFNTEQLLPKSRPEELIKKVSDWIGKKNESRHLYYFKVIGKIDVEKIGKRFEKAKSNEESRAYPQSNFDSNSHSKYLYVGISADVKQRFKQHLGYGPERTYSMHLACWAKTLKLPIEFYCMRFNAEAKLLQAIEDGYWESLKPLLGKKGSK